MAYAMSRCLKPDRLRRRRRLDELLHRITGCLDNNNYQPCRMVDQAYHQDKVTEGATNVPEQYYKVNSPEEASTEAILPRSGALVNRPSVDAEQEFPLDLSMLTLSKQEARSPPPHAPPPPYAPPPTAPTEFTPQASTSTPRETVSTINEHNKYRNDEESNQSWYGRLTAISPQLGLAGFEGFPLSSSPINAVVEQVTNNDGVIYPCVLCGQVFSLRDRLAKHIASRHRSLLPADVKPQGSGRTYECRTCCRIFARSDMLTRHARVHSGDKPYYCKICGQDFTRSDHLATHQRTHTGVKPYKCPACPYAACRRDMITRHMRTHAANRRSRSPAVSAAATTA